VQREELNRYLDGLLEVSQFRDYCLNGLQVEGRGEIRRIVSGVTASIDLIQAALIDEADAIAVRHGYLWNGDDPRLTGTRRACIGVWPSSLRVITLPKNTGCRLWGTSGSALRHELRFIDRHSQASMSALPVRSRGASFSPFISTC